jgi:hypothetical protein
MDFKDFNFAHWWTLAAAAGGTIAAASGAVSFVPGLLIGVSFLFFGIGEWINHPRQRKKETVQGMVGFKTVDDFPRKPSFIGVTLDALAIAAFCFGIYKLILAP